MFTKYGYSTIGFVAIISLFLILFSFYLSNVLISILILVVVLLIIIFTLNFFRDPERTPPKKDNVILSPADGKVLIVKDIVCDRFLSGNAKQISIFMSPLNVHVNRIPISGKVEYLNYIKGKFLKAYVDKADSENERMEIGISTGSSKVLFTQVAGYVARRIVCELKEGQPVNIGDRFGMIKFGSRVDVIVPAGWNAVVSEGTNVKAGESILFEFDK